MIFKFKIPLRKKTEWEQENGGKKNIKIKDRNGGRK